MQCIWAENDCRDIDYVLNLHSLFYAFHLTPYKLSQKYINNETLQLSTPVPAVCGFGKRLAGLR